MATKEEKLKALAGMGVNPEHVLQQAEATEKELDGQGVAFKEGAAQADAADADSLDAALKEAEELVAAIKAKKAQPAAQPADQAVADPGEDGQFDDGDLPDNAGATDDEEEEKEFEPVIGNENPDQFYTKVKELVTEAVAAALPDALKAVLSDLIATQQPAAKEQQAPQADPQVEALQKQVKELHARVGDLLGETPKAARGYVASTAEDTLIKDEKAKELGAPEADAYAAQFVSNFVFGR